MEPTSKQYKPTYISVPKLEQVINLISTRNFPKITTKMFEAEKYSSSDAALAVSMLKFLGIVADDGASTPLMSKLHLKGDARKTEFEKIVRNAYSALFAVVDKPQELNSDDLANEMVRQYGLTPRLVGGAVKAFLKLCEYAGLKEEGSIVSKARAPRGASRVTTSKSDGTKLTSAGKKATGSFDAMMTVMNNDVSTINIVEGKLIICIDRKWQEAALFDEVEGSNLRKLLAAAKQYAASRQQNESSNAEAPEDS